MSESAVRQMLKYIRLTVIDFGAEFAYQAGLLRRITKGACLSLGDRACLALARELKLPVLTTDRAWSGLDLGVQIEMIR